MPLRIEALLHAPGQRGERRRPAARTPAPRRASRPARAPASHGRRHGLRPAGARASASGIAVGHAQPDQPARPVVESLGAGLACAAQRPSVALATARIEMRHTRRVAAVGERRAHRGSSRQSARERRLVDLVDRAERPSAGLRARDRGSATDGPKPSTRSSVAAPLPSAPPATRAATPCRQMRRARHFGGRAQRQRHRARGRRIVEPEHEQRLPRSRRAAAP